MKKLCSTSGTLGLRASGQGLARAGQGGARHFWLYGRPNGLTDHQDPVSKVTIDNFNTPYRQNDVSRQLLERRQLSDVNFFTMHDVTIVHRAKLLSVLHKTIGFNI